MAKLRADQRNYKNAFKKHMHTYDNYVNGSKISRRLILCYGVECGLKCLIMQNNNINRVSQADAETEKVLGSHDFRKLLRTVKKAGQFQFKNVETEYGEIATAENFHQIYRYCINIESRDAAKMDDNEKVLQEIAEWLREVI